MTQFCGGKKMARKKGGEENLQIEKDLKDIYTK